MLKHFRKKKHEITNRAQEFDILPIKGGNGTVKNMNVTSKALLQLLPQLTPEYHYCTHSSQIRI